MAKFTYDFPLGIRVIGKVTVEAESEDASWDVVLKELDLLGKYLIEHTLDSLAYADDRNMVIEQVYPYYESIDIELVENEEDE